MGTNRGEGQGARTNASFRRYQSITVTTVQTSITNLLAAEGYNHPVNCDIDNTLQIELVAPAAAVTVFDPQNDDDGEVVAAEGSLVIPVAGGDAYATRLSAADNTAMLVKIYYS